MPTKAFYWQLYIATYTALLGLPFLLFPKSVIPYMGFDPSMVDEGPFVRLTGMFLLCLTMITFRIWQKKIEEMVLGTVVLRLFIIAVLLTMGLREGFPFLLIMVGVVGFGVAGTLWTLRNTNLKQFI
jgi:hypothetical protein